MTMDAAILKQMTDSQLLLRGSSIWPTNMLELHFFKHQIGSDKLTVISVVFIPFFYFRSQEKLSLMEPFLLRIGILNHYSLCQKVLWAQLRQGVHTSYQCPFLKSNKISWLWQFGAWNLQCIDQWNFIESWFGTLPVAQQKWFFGSHLLNWIAFWLFLLSGSDTLKNY